MTRTTEHHGVRSRAGLGALLSIALFACGSSDTSGGDPARDPGKTVDGGAAADTGAPIHPLPATDGGTEEPVDAADPPKSSLPAPPATWKEHWFEHNQVLTLEGYNDDVALYFDDSIDRAKTKWMLPYLTKVWQYTRKTYPGLGPDRLFAIFHQGRYSGGHPSTHFDDSHDNRNVIDCGGDQWDEGKSYDMPTHEIGHIVESASYEHHGSPAFPLWQDSKWMEFYLYDVYASLGMTDEAKRWQGEMAASGHTDDFPKAGTRWFQNWFFPLWRDYGGAKVMTSFFGLLAQHFPTNGVDYARDLTWGEYIHFTSGAAKKDLKPLATAAFGWPADWETQYQKAKKDFPKITY
jgi:hypothetical protein